LNRTPLDLPELIEWHEGMLLSPQHFQQFAARHELLSHFLFTQATPFAWGIRKLQIDETALGAGLLSILNLEAILPDGLLILAGSERGVKLEFDLAKAQGDIVRVYLQVPPDPAVYARSESSRYRGVPSNGHVESDSVSGSEAIPIPHVRPKIQLVSDDVDLRGMTTLPLVEFARKGAVCQKTDFIAPALRVEQGSDLANLCAPVIRLVRDKATSLAVKMSPNGRGSDASGIYQLQSLICCLPTVEALLGSDQAHPYTLYLALCSMAGSVAVLSNARVPHPFRPYDHDNLLKSFDEVLGFIRQAIGEGIVDHWIARELQPAHGDSNSKRLWLGPKLEAAFGAGANWSAPFFGLVVNAPAGTPPEEFVRWGETCLLASEDLISDLARERSLGASCERVDRLEDLTAPPGSVLFRVKNDRQWIDGKKALVLEPARQETHRPHSVLFYVSQRSREAKDG
jgi:type VI secretion system protein ImpJ